MPAYFDQLERVRYEGTKSTNPLAFRHYNSDELVLGKRMEDHLRFAACYWHTFCWNGADMFGVGAFNRPWQQPGEALELAKRKADVAFEFFHKLNVPYYCFHDVDVSPEGASLKEYKNNFAQMVDVLAAKQEQSGVKLLWGTANCFTNPRYGAGAATNPDPEVFSWAATQVVTAMDATHKLGGENYVLWGGREGYETLLNTDLRQEREQIGRFMQLVVEHKHKTGFEGNFAYRAEAAGTDQAPVRLRCGDRIRIPQAVRSGKRDQTEYRSQPRHAGGSLVPSRNRHRYRAGSVWLCRCQPWGRATGLGY